MTSTGGVHQNTHGLEILQKTRNYQGNLVGEGTKILLTRKGLAREDLKIESFVETELTSKGFLVVNPESLSIQEQISLFGNAKIIVGFHGGALTNMVWSKKGTNVYEILVHPYRTRDFERLANSLELDYKVLSLELGLDELMNEIKKIE
jgi:capsular polysaccharide biosynthesis protein